MTQATTPDAEAIRENLAALTAEETAAAQVNAAAMLFSLQKTLDELEPQVEFGDVPAEKQYYTLGYCCQLFQSPPQIVREIAKRAEVRFSHSVNDVPYLDGDAVLKMNRYLAELRRQHETQE